jgi:hypothetical protein
MLKKVVLILMINIYAVSSFGIGIRQFFCCGRLKSTDITLIDHNKKKCDNGNGSGGCCKTTYKIFKVKDAHYASGEINCPDKFFLDIPQVAFVSEPARLPVSSKSIANSCHAPPSTEIPIYILHCVYRI